jgi:GTPase SAR1 family protein
LNRLTELHSTLKLLRKAYERTGMADADHVESAGTMTSLRLAEAFLEKKIAAAQQSRRIEQIAVLGPTQAGKSTVVNLLLGERHAQTSPLAGFTVHPQAFALNLDASVQETLDAYFHGFKRSALRDLTPVKGNNDYTRFACEQISVAPNHPLAHTVVWDTPDFDSVDAVRYRHGLVRTIAFADIVLIVLSKDKYADQSVWDMIELIAPLKQPTVLCINKVDAGASAALTQALQNKWRLHRQDAPSALIVLPYRKHEPGAEPQLESAELLHAVQKLAGRAPNSDAAQPAIELTARHWAEWIAPIQEERQALKRWNTLIDDNIAEAVKLYQRDYLEHPRHYHTFQRALAELLTLLEIPGFARGIALTRQVLTWPFRQLARLGHQNKPSSFADNDREIALLTQIFDHLLIRVSEAALDAAEDDNALRSWWRELVQKLRLERPAAASRFLNAASGYHQDFKSEIEQTAQLLHRHLSRQPAVLNSLRATRAFADTTALALALHTGGIGFQDFIIAPATISMTSFLTESALGHYLGKAQNDLKERQLQQVKALFQTQAEQTLRSLPSRTDPGRRFSIAPERLESVEKLLDRHAR